MIYNKKRKNILASFQKINLFKGVLLQKGNKERILTYLLRLYKFLKIPTNVKGISKGLKNKPLQIINNALTQSAPIFTYRRIVKAGRLYEIPVPISPNRATFMASYWIRKVATKRTTEGSPMHHFVGAELINILRKKGAVLEQLNTYTADGLEKNIFKKMIRKKRSAVSRSKGVNSYKAVLSRMNRLVYKRKFRGKTKQITYSIMRLKKRHDGRQYRLRKQKEFQKKNGRKGKKQIPLKISIKKNRKRISKKFKNFKK